jgi:hypothetical protein
MIGVGKLKKLNRCAVFDDERDPHALRWAVRRNQYFPACQLGRKVTHLKSNMGHLPHQFGNRCVRFEPHPFHAILAVFVSNNKDLEMLDVALSRSRLAGWNSNVVIATQFLASVPEQQEFYEIILRRGKVATSGNPILGFGVYNAQYST